jgi:hypothetical protein
MVISMNFIEIYVILKLIKCYHYLKHVLTYVLEKNRQTRFIAEPKVWLSRMTLLQGVSWLVSQFVTYVAITPVPKSKHAMFTQCFSSAPGV